MKRIIAPRLSITLAVCTVVVLFSMVRSGQAQLPSTPDWIGQLILANDDLFSMSSPASTQGTARPGAQVRAVLRDER
jgi:hypothetical protein